MCPIFDLWELNKCVITEHLRLISHTNKCAGLSPTWRLYDKIDISQAYFHIPITKPHRHFLRIIQQCRYEMTCLHSFFIICWIVETPGDDRVLVCLENFLLVHQDRSKLSLQTTEPAR